MSNAWCLQQEDRMIRWMGAHSLKFRSGLRSSRRRGAGRADRGHQPADKLSAYRNLQRWRTSYSGLPLKGISHGAVITRSPARQITNGNITSTLDSAAADGYRERCTLFQNISLVFRRL